MSVQIVCRLTVVLVALFIVPQAVAQSDSPAYCASIIDHCHDQNVPSGGLYAGFSGTPSQQRQQWTEFCFAVGMADTCLATLPAECLLDAAIDRIHHTGACTLEYSDFINVDECTDDAIADSQLTDCDELAEKRFESDITDACGYITEILRCSNDSFIRHCGQEFGTFFGSMYTRGTVLSAAPHLPMGCSLLSLIATDVIALPASVEHCQEQIQDCFERITPEFLEFVTEIPFRRACSNLDNLKNCLSAVTTGDGDCENLVREEVFYFDYLCGSGHSVGVLNESIECLGKAARRSGECGVQGSSICLAYENFQECYERIIRRQCSFRYEDIAIDIAAVIKIPPVMHFLPENCPLLDRLPSSHGVDGATNLWGMAAYLTVALISCAFAGERL